MWVAWGATTGVEVIPLDWPGEAIPAKVLMIGRKDGRFLGYAVADLSDRELKVYPAGRIHSDIGTTGGSITSRGDVLIDGNSVGYLVPGGDFTKPLVPVQPSRYAPGRGDYEPMGFVTDPTGSLVWIYQDINMPGLWPDPRGGTKRRIQEMWVDLFDLDTGEIVLTAEIHGDWGVAGALDAGLLLRERHNRVFKVNRHTIDSTVLEEPGRILILRPDGSREFVTPDLDGTPNLDAPAEGWRQGFGIGRPYRNHFTLEMEGEMYVVEADTGVTHPVPKPGAGVWRWTGLPEINIESSSWQNSDVFLMRFQTTVSGQLTDEWSMYEVRLSDQSVRRIHDSRLRAKSVANGTAALAFTGWPVSPDNDAVINLIGPNGELIPVTEVPDDFFFLDAS